MQSIATAIVDDQCLRVVCIGLQSLLVVPLFNLLRFITQSKHVYTYCRLMEQLCGEAKSFILKYPQISGNLIITYVNQLFPSPPLQTDAVK